MDRRLGPRDGLAEADKGALMQLRNVVETDIGVYQDSCKAGEHSHDQIELKIPYDGRCWSHLRAELLARKEGDYQWRSGRVPLYVYFDNDELLSVAREAYDLYFTENALGSRAFPSVMQMEKEVLQMSLWLFHAPGSADGSFTSGGTESLFLALKAARDYFRATHSKILGPKVIVPRTAHPAFDKAAHYLGLDVIRIDTGADLRVDVAALEGAIDARTMMICGSAPCYPYGVYDSIAALGEIAVRKRIWFHVDACLGGFLAPFARDEGYPIPHFDFLIPGVTSLSADLHKYGFSAKGASILLYRSASMKTYQGFHFDNWPRGTYATDTFLGSRPGGAVASAWAVLQYLGQSGYRRLARKTMEAKQRLMQGIEEIGGLEVVRPSELSILLYKSADPAVDINAVAELLGQRGWFVGRTREPPALHLALNAVHSPIVDEYLADLSSAVREVRASGKVGARDDSTY
jgi:glutamate/tyrosine decarboxylase-like PLP-dependent enzyme